MDEIVAQAMAKWPNVPDCYGWLALDARGNWRMRDDHAQRAGLPGETIRHPALLAFICRNYAVDATGRWYFQNGPQRVFVDLEAAPYVARTDPAHGLLLQTGAPFADGQEAPRVWLSELGRFVFQAGDIVASLDDRDAGACLAGLEIDGAPAADAALEDWLAGGGGVLTLHWRGWRADVQRLPDAGLAAHFGYVSRPRH